jgi:hypothetical protein
MFGGNQAPHSNQPSLSMAMVANNNENEITNTVVKSTAHIGSPLIAETPAEFRFERLCLHRPALIVGGKLKHPSLHCLVKECLSLTSTRFSARAVSLAGREKGLLVHWQFASPSRGRNGARGGPRT